MYAVGVFLAFTLSQTGMVVHWLKERQEHWRRRAVVNGIGALATGIVLLDILAEKFFEGAWLVVLMLAALCFLFRAISAHYHHVREQLSTAFEMPALHTRDHVVVVPVSGLHRGIFPALEYARSLSSDCRALYVEIDPSRTEALVARWRATVPDVSLVVLKSPFRSLLRPLLRYLDALEHEDHKRYVTVVIPEFVTPTWWQRFLHGNTALLIKLALANRRHIVIANVRYHLPSRKSCRKAGAARSGSFATPIRTA
jgi:hypothetical protein